MHFGLLTALFPLVIAFVGAQTYGINNLPDCTTNCTAAAAKAVGCSLADQKCLCAQADFSTNTIRCAKGVCGPVELNEASNVFYQMCASPTSSTSTSSPTSPTSSPAGSPPGSTAAAPSNSNNNGGGTATPTVSPTDAGGSSGSTMTTSFNAPGSRTSSSSTSMVVQTVVVSQSPNVSPSSLSSSSVRTKRRFGAAYAVLSATVACLWLVRL